jgi:hypothetical protein
MEDIKLYKQGLEAKGFKVEIFDGDMIPQIAKDDWVKKTKSGKWLTDSEVLSTEMYKANQQWINQMIKEGYDIYDIGNLKALAGDGLSINSYSPFYEMERTVVFP